MVWIELRSYCTHFTVFPCPHVPKGRVVLHSVVIFLIQITNFRTSYSCSEISTLLGIKQTEEQLAVLKIKMRKTKRINQCNFPLKNKKAEILTIQHGRASIWGDRCPACHKILLIWLSRVRFSSSKASPKGRDRYADRRGGGWVFTS